MSIRPALFVPLVVAACATDLEDTSTTSQELGPLITLRSYWSAANGDNALSTNPSFAPAGYSPVRIEGRIFSPDAPRPTDTIPLWTWYGAARGDYMTTTNPYWSGGPGDVRNNYSFVRLEGYVHSNDVAGTVPLQLWWSSSRADNNTTTDPRFTVDPTVTRSPDYGFARNEGYVFPTGEQTPSKKENFRWGELGNAPRGERDLLVLLLDYPDVPMRHAPVVIDNLMFGPSYPNVRDYTNVASQRRFTWRRGAVLGPYAYPDDPQTSANEASYYDSWNTAETTATTTLAFVHLRATSGKLVLADATRTFTPGGNGDQNKDTFAFHDLDGGTLDPGDRVAFKASNGKWVRDDGGTLRADATSTSSPATQFVITSAYARPIVDDDVVTLRSVATGRYLIEASATPESTNDELITTSNGIVSAANVFTIYKALCPNIERQAHTMIARADAAGYNFAVHDHDHNGVVDATELAIVVVVTNPVMGDGASTRPMSTFTLPSGLRIRTGWATSAGEDASFMTYAHELTHLAGTSHEMYRGVGTSMLSTMSATIFGEPDVMWTFMLDAWHRLRFGWVEPDIQALNTVGGISLQAVSTQLSTRPLVLYDPRRYDTFTKTGEYFILEYRDSSRAYDRDVGGPGGEGAGVVIWQVKEPAGDADVNVLLPSEANRQLWRATDGPITLRHADGGDSGFRVRLGAVPGSTNLLAVEWSRDGLVRPRVDTTPVDASPGESITVDGVFPFDDGSTVRLTNVSTGWMYWATVTVRGPTRITATIPATVPAGTYHLTVSCNGSHSNRHPIQVN